MNPRRAKRTTPNGVAKFVGWRAVRYERLMDGRTFTKIPRTIMMIAMTPYVSIRFSPFSPRFSKRVMIIQKKNAKKTGGVFPGISLARDSPSPIR